MNSEFRIPSLVIIPGWGGTKETWAEFVQLAQADFEVQVIELPCFGDEPCPDTVWGVEDYAEFVKSKLLIRNSKFIILGHSFGGAVASTLVAKNPDICDKLILSGPALFRPRKKIRKILFRCIAKIGKILFKLPFLEKFDVLAKKVLYHTAHSDYNETSGIKRGIFKKIVSEDRKNILPDIKNETLIIHGTNDKYVPIFDSKRAIKIIPNSKLEIVQDGKHGLHIQQPENLIKIIKSFVL